MNAFEALGLAYKALHGARIVIVMDRYAMIRPAIRAVDEQARWITDSVRHVTDNLEERIEVGAQGGEIVFTFRRSPRLHQYRADVVLIDRAWAQSSTELARIGSIAPNGVVVHR